MLQQFEQTAIEMEHQSHHKKYLKYTKEMRIKLIELVDQEKLTTAHAARIVGIKQTSACRIMKNYHEANRIFQRRADKVQRQKIEEKSRSIASTKNMHQNNHHSNFQADISPVQIEQKQNQEGVLRNFLQCWQENINFYNINSGMNMLQPIIQENIPQIPIYYQNMYPYSYNYFM